MSAVYPATKENPTYILPRRVVQIQVDPPHLLVQPALCFTHIVGDRVVLDKRGRLGAVVLLGRNKEGSLEVLVVHREHLTLSVRLVDTERDCISAHTPEGDPGGNSLP